MPARYSSDDYNTEYPSVWATTMRAWMHLGHCVALLACCTNGCQHAAPAIPSDPIFASKQPILSKPELKPPSFAAYLEPEVPVGPVEAVAVRSKTGSEVVPACNTIRGQSSD
jgi:hypothetical protein